MDKFVIHISKPSSSRSVESPIRNAEQNIDFPNPVESSSDVENFEEPKIKKKKIYKQMFRNDWKTSFKWLDVNEDNIAFCVPCKLNLKGGVTHFQRHENTHSHKQNYSRAKNSMKLDEFCKISETRVKNEKAIKRAEIKLVAFLHEHNLSFLLMDHLILLLISIFPDSGIAKGLKCNRTKATALTNSILSDEQTENITKYLQNKYFSIIIDETTDVSSQKSLVLIARFFDNMQNRCRDLFIGLIRLRECNAQSIFDSICFQLLKFKIPIGNLLGFAADNATVMMGNIAGVQALFREQLPNIYVLGCVCHSMHLCASAATKKIPQEIEDFIRNIYNHFAHSSKIKEALEEFQKFVNSKPRKLLHPSQTRWLSLQAAIDRILENWDPLTLYFRNENFEEKLKSNRTILDSLENNVFKLYLYFLSYILNMVNKLNQEFQAEKPKLFNLDVRVSDLFRGILKNFMKKESFENTDLQLIDISNPRNFLLLEELYTGAQTEILILNANLDAVDIHNFRLRALEFYIELTSQIRKRFNFADPVLHYLKILNPEVAVSGDVNSIVAPAIKYFPQLVDDVETLNTEWRMLSDLSELKKFDLSDVESFWSKIFNMKNNLNEKMFPILGKLINGLLSLPHSSAAAERSFSQVSLLKTKLRNRIDIETLDSILHVKELLNNQSCYSWEPSERLIHRPIKY